MELTLLIKSPRILIFNIATAVSFLFFSRLALAAACCGGGFAMPSVITGDDKAQLTTSYSYSKIDTDVFSNGVWQKRTADDSTQIYKIEAAHIFADRFQYGLSLPLQTRKKEGSIGGQSTGLGDISGQLGYEFLPDWNYNPWRPKGIGFIALTLPTGKSIYESEDNGLDSRGRGFYSIGIGTTLTKTWTRWDMNALLEVHHAFNKSVNNSQFQGTVAPGNGSNLSIGTGYNIQDFRLGGTIAWIYEDPINVHGNIPSNGSEQRYSTGTLSTSYLFADSWAGTFSYSDQTLFGDPTNTSLTKSIQLSLQKRWSR